MKSLAVDLLEFAYDASGVEGLGAAMLRDDDEGNVVCYFIEHEWTDAEKRYHINVKDIQKVLEYDRGPFLAI